MPNTEQGWSHAAEKGYLKEEMQTARFKRGLLNDYMRFQLHSPAIEMQFA